ncbi:MAG: transporter [Comamonadaceae bacterium]|nr:transporter [Comamonadaceae bacterium]
MKKLLSMLAVVMTLGLGAAHFDAEAKRIGGGKSVGMQRQAAPPAKAPDATPSAAPAAGAGAAAAAPKRSWMGPVAGLAAGLGLAALASHLGFGEELANMLMIGLLVMAVIAVIGFVMRKKAAQQGGGAAYAAAGAGAGQPNNTLRMPPTQPTPATPAYGQGGSMIGSGIGANVPQQARIPADFDANSFARNAKVQFIRLQASNDAGNLDDIREFTSPEMFAEIQMDIQERNGATQETRVMELNAEVLEVAEEGNRYVVSVRFTGRVQEDGGAPDDVNEIWHLTKPLSGGGWVLSGIQMGA